MQVNKKPLELDMEQHNGSKFEKEYIKAVYCHLTYLTYIRVHDEKRWAGGSGGVQPPLSQGIRSGDGVGDLFNYLFIKDIKSNKIRIAQ